MAVNFKATEMAKQLFFLSCLRGSEQNIAEWVGMFVFLSCLRGSERESSLLPYPLAFLSCLRGSELDAVNYDVKQ